GAPPMLELPTDRPRPAVQSYRGARESFQVSLEVTQGLKELGRQEGATLFMLLLAAFQALLHRYSGQEDISVGSPIANRNRAEIEGLIGFFVNMLVLRTDLGGDPSFRELLSRVREVALNAYAHQDLPFEQLVEALQPERNMAQNPLFQVALVLQNAPSSNLELKGLSLRPVGSENGGALFDLRLSIWELTQTLRGSLEYRADLFEAATISRLLGHFQNLLGAAVANPDQRLSRLPLLGGDERHQLLLDYNAKTRVYPSRLTIHELFQQQAERTPGAVAVLYKEDQLNYRELNARANQLAHYLRKLGVGPDVRVGLLFERSIKMVAALLGFLKAGGAYLPLDPAYPAERLEFMMADAEIPVLITLQNLADELQIEHANVICLDKEGDSINAQSIHNPTINTSSAN